jgi:hypothetical protein
LDAAIAAETRRAIKLVIGNFEEHGEAGPATRAELLATSYTSEQILGDWFPPEPKP